MAALAHGLFALAISSSLYGGDAATALRLVPTTAVTTALVAPLAFHWLGRLDRRLAPDPARLRMS